MSDTSTAEKPKVSTHEAVKFLPFMCENTPLFKDIDKAISLMPPSGIQHRQREIWKMAPKRDEKKNIVRDADGHIVMIKVVTRNAKTVTVKNEGGLRAFTSSGVIEPMDFTDVREVISLLEK